MKHLLCLLIIVLTGCNRSSNIKEIEILSYYTNAKKFSIYSSIDNKGFAQTLSKSEISDFTDNYQSKIRKNLMDSIINVCKNSTENEVRFKRSKGMWYCGKNHSIKITYENGNELTFQYPIADDANKQFLPFQSLFRQIQDDSLKAQRLDIGHKGKLYIKQENLSNFTWRKDSIRNYLASQEKN